MSEHSDASNATRRARQVCLQCRSRKKKCDKTLPRCSFCSIRGIACQYSLEKAPRASGLVKIAAVLSHPTSILEAGARISAHPSCDSDGISAQAYRIIQATGRYVDDAASRYFKSIHGWLPIISRKDFHDALIGPDPHSDEFSILLLGIYLTTDGSGSGGEDQQRRGRGCGPSIYPSTRMLLASAQALNPRSITLIQAGVLCAVFEYAQCRAEAAHLTIGTCARMALAAGLDQRLEGSHRHADEDLDLDLDLERKRNLWWSIVVLERMISCETNTPAGQLTTVIPSAAHQVPLEAEVLDSIGVGVVVGTLAARQRPAISDLAATDIGEYAAEVMATYLLDRALQAIIVSDTADQHAELVLVDHELRSFTSSVMDKHSHQKAKVPFCGAIAIAVRALFAVHTHLLRVCKGLAEQCKTSLVALNTVTNIAVDIAHSHSHIGDMGGDSIEDLPPFCLYMFRAALEHLSVTGYADHDAWTRDCDALRLTLRLFEGRWGIMPGKSLSF